MDCSCGGKYKYDYNREFYVCDSCGEHNLGEGMSALVIGISRLKSDSNFNKAFFADENRGRVSNGVTCEKWDEDRIRQLP